MPRYQVIEHDGELYVPLRYDNFAALGAPVEPLVPWAAVPLRRSIHEVIAEAGVLQTELSRQLTAMGVHRVCPRPDHKIGYLDKLNFPFRFFRGERSLRFSIMPTRYRFTGQTDASDSTRQRIEFETRCAVGMMEYLKQHGAPDASHEIARAAARHHGAPSSFVDFTFLPDVAAFFAHPAFSSIECERGADIGILYTLGIEDFQALFGMAAWGLPPGGGRDIHWLNVNRVWRIPYKSFDPERRIVADATLLVSVPSRLVAKPLSIRTRIVPAIPRIVAQEGIFLEAYFEDPEDWWSQVFIWTVLDFSCRKWCFLRQDFLYENPAAGITASILFPPDDPELAELTRDFGNCP